MGENAVHQDTIPAGLAEDERRLARAGRMDGIVWLALGAVFVHTSLLFGYGELWMTGSPMLWVTAFAMVVTIPLAVGHIARTLFRRGGAPEDQRRRGILLALLMAAAVLYAASPGHLMSLPVVAVGLRATGKADHLQSWAMVLLDTSPFGTPVIGKTYRYPPDRPAFLGNPEVSLYPSVPDGARVTMPSEPGTYRPYAIELRFNGLDRRILRAGYEGFRASPEPGFTMYRVSDGLYLYSCSLNPFSAVR